MALPRVALLLFCLTCCSSAKKSSTSHRDDLAKTQETPLTIVMDSAEDQQELAESVLGKAEENSQVEDAENDDEEHTSESHADAGQQTKNHVSHKGEESHTSGIIADASHDNVALHAKGHGHGDEGHDSGAHGKGHGDEGHDSGAHGKGHGEHGKEGHGEHGKEDHHGGHGSGGHVSGGHGSGDHGGHGHGHSHSKGAKAVALGLIATVTLVPLVLWMALEDGLVAQLTLKMLDSFISIFLAVLWYNCLSQALVTFEVASFFPYAAELFGLIQVLSLYAIAMHITYQWKDDKNKVITFSGCAAHCIAFSAISLCGHTQASTSEDLASGDMEPVVSLVFGFVVIAAILGMSEANSMIWRNKVDHHLLNHCVDELELDIMGLVGSFLITQAVRHALIGHYPPLGHFFLQIEGHGPVHKPWQRMAMLGWAVGLTILSAILLPHLDKLHGGKMMHKFVHLAKVTLIMLVAWGYLLWGQWEFYEVFFHGDIMFGNMVFSIFMTMVALAVLYSMAKSVDEEIGPEQKATFNMVVTAVGLVAAWSWEHCFNLAFDVVGQQYQVGYKGLMPKLVLSIVIPAALLPTYVRHIKSRVIEDEEREHAAAHHDAKHHEAS